MSEPWKWGEDRRPSDAYDTAPAGTRFLMCGYDAHARDFASGDWVRYKDYASLEAEVERLNALIISGGAIVPDAKPVEDVEAENARLKAEVERLRKAAIEPSQVVRLTEEGVQDVPYHYAEKYLIEVSKEAYIPFCKMMMEYWDASNAAKDGKPSE